MDRPSAGTEESATEESARGSWSGGVRRRRVLGGVAAGLAAPVVSGAVPGGGPFGRAAAAGRPPTEDWTSSPADSDINALFARAGVLVGSTADGYVSVDQASGDRLWRYSIQDQRVAVKFHQGSAYVVDGQTLVALDGSDGKRWSNAYDNPVGFNKYGTKGYVASGSTLESLSLADGSTGWSTQVSNLNSLEHAGENALITTEGGPNSAIVAAHDPSDGTQLWRKELVETVYRKTLSLGSDYIYFGYDGTLDAISIADGSVAWSRSFTGGVPFVYGFGSRPIAVDEGKVAGLSTEDGSEVWSLSGFDGTPFPVGFPDSGLILGTRSTLHAITFDGTRRWSYDLQNTSNFAAVTTVGDLVYTVDDGTAYEIDGGSATWSFEGSGGTLRTVASDGQRLYANDLSTVYAFEHGASTGGGTTATPSDSTTKPDAGTTAGGTTDAPSGGTTASSGTDAPSGGTTDAMDSDGGTTASGGGGGGGTDGDGGGSDGGSGGSPGFGVLATLAAALVAAARLLGDDESGDE